MANIFNEATHEALSHLNRTLEQMADLNHGTDAAAQLWSFVDRRKVMCDAQARLVVGRWFIAHYRGGAAERGHGAVARQLKKQGVPFEVALQVLGLKERTL